MYAYYISETLAQEEVGSLLESFPPLLLLFSFLFYILTSPVVRLSYIRHTSRVCSKQECRASMIRKDPSECGKLFLIDSKFSS